MEKHTWESHWEHINRSFVERAIERYKTASGYRKLLNAVSEIGNNGRSLEVGAGKAYLSRLLHLRGWQTTAIDIDKGVVTANSEVVDQYLIGDMFKLPFKNDSFDLVMSCGLFEHFPLDTLRNILSEMKRVGVNVAAWFPTCSIEWHILWAARKMLGSDLFIKVHKHNAQDLETLFSALGFNKVRSGAARFGGIFSYAYIYGTQAQ
ncbi:MAG: class I SAM-dependent methyltransferase [Candidatus Omnitrophica bacterium]|nr:class I SAM-dependent methyltransferase [Candidatus Omnitrophota bacterium]